MLRILNSAVNIQGATNHVRIRISFQMALMKTTRIFVLKIQIILITLSVIFWH